MTKILNCFLFVINGDTNPKKIILILNILKLVFINNFIAWIRGLKYLHDGPSITKKRTQDNRLSIGKSLGIILLYSASILVCNHMLDHNRSKLFYCFFLLVLNENHIMITLYYWALYLFLSLSLCWSLWANLMEGAVGCFRGQ